MVTMTSTLQRRGLSLRAAVLAGVAAVAGVGTTMGAAHAQVTETFTVSATLNDALALTENTALDFGTLLLSVNRVSGATDSDGNAIAILSPAGIFSDGSGTNASALSVVAGTPGSYSVDAGVPAFTNVSLTFDDLSTPVDLDPIGAPPGSPALQLTGLAIAASTGTVLAGCTATAVGDGSACPVQTDAAGIFTFDLGGTVAAVAADAPALAYQQTNTVYQGTIDITVSRT